jgi:hypothetical protein
MIHPRREDRDRSQETAVCGEPGKYSESKNETVYHFVTPECDVRMTVEFYGGYSSEGVCFNERRTNGQYCLSGQGQEGRHYLTTLEEADR